MTSAAEDDVMELDSLAFATCLRCGGGGFGGGAGEIEDERSKLLVCSEVGCPNAIHEACVSSEREIDGAGKFCCPYCAHKRALDRAESLREKAMKSKDLLSRFISMSCGVGVLAASEESREEEEENLSEDNVGVGIDGGDEGTEERNLVDAVAPETGDFQGGSPLLRKKRYKRKAQRISGCEVEDVVVENDEERSEKDRNDVKGDDESSKLRRSQSLNRHERGIPLEFNLTRVVGPNLNEKDTNYISAGLRDIPERRRNEKATNNVSSESREIPERRRNEKATNNVSSESREIPELSKKEVLPKSTQVLDSNQNVQTSSSAQPVKFEDFGSEHILYESMKGRRIRWTLEELKELKEGVLYFSMEVNKNIPWRKILERGDHIFHKTRTADNLKDKWKALCKEAEALNR